MLRTVCLAALAALAHAQDPLPGITFSAYISAVPTECQAAFNVRVPDSCCEPTGGSAQPDLWNLTIPGIPYENGDTCRLVNALGDIGFTKIASQFYLNCEAGNIPTWGEFCQDTWSVPSPETCNNQCDLVTSSFSKATTAETCGQGCRDIIRGSGCYPIRYPSEVGNFMANDYDPVNNYHMPSPKPNYDAATVSGMQAWPGKFFLWIPVCKSPYGDVPTCSPAVPGATTWTSHEDKNCHTGHGATSIGLLGYVTTVDECKARCTAQAGCTAITVFTNSQWMACHSRSNVVIGSCYDSPGYDTHIATGSGPSPPSTWIVTQNFNCHNGAGATDLGLLGYVQTVDDCKARCLARAGCEGFVIGKGRTYKACHARADINIANAYAEPNWDIYVAPGYSGNGRLAGVDPATGKAFPNVDRGVAYNQSATKPASDNDKPVFFGLGALTGFAAAALFFGAVLAVRAKQPVSAKAVELKVVSHPNPAQPAWA